MPNEEEKAKALVERELHLRRAEAMETRLKKYRPTVQAKLSLKNSWHNDWKGQSELSLTIFLPECIHTDRQRIFIHPTLIIEPQNSRRFT